MQLALARLGCGEHTVTVSVTWTVDRTLLSLGRIQTDVVCVVVPSRSTTTSTMPGQGFSTSAWSPGNPSLHTSECWQRQRLPILACGCCLQPRLPCQWLLLQRVCTSQYTRPYTCSYPYQLLSEQHCADLGIQNVKWHLYYYLKSRLNSVCWVVPVLALCRFCFFDKATQMDNGGGHETSLGFWKGFEKGGTEVCAHQLCLAHWVVGSAPSQLALSTSAGTMHDAVRGCRTDLP